MKIIIVTHTMGIDGPERVLSVLSNYWCENGIEVEILLTYPSRRNERYAINEKIKVVSIESLSKFKLFRGLYHIKRIIKTLKSKENRDAIAISFMNGSSLCLSIAGLFVRNKIVLSERNDPRSVPFRKSERLLRNIAFKMADLIVFQTEEAKSCFPKRVQKKSAVILNPLSNDLPLPFKGKRRKAFVAVSRLSKQKNLEMMINGFSKFVTTNNDFCLEIYGDGLERQNLEQMVNNLNLTKYVLFKGFVENVFDYIYDAYCFLSTSNYEGLSNSMIESLALGLPCIVTDCPAGGARAVIENNFNGLLIPVGDENAFVDAMETVVLDLGKAAYLSKNAIKIRDELSIDVISNKWISFMKEGKI